MSIYEQTETNGRRFLMSKPAAPLPTSTAYFLKTEKETSIKTFNALEGRQLKAVTISGMTLFIDGVKDENHLFKELNGAQNIESITFIVDEIIINRPLALPGSNVTMYARKLTFQDTGQLVTTPVQWTTAAINSNGTKNGADGEDGQAAGNVTLHIHDFDLGKSLRFDLRGGDGQDPGAGVAGIDGRDAEVWDFQMFYHLTTINSPIPTYRRPDVDPEALNLYVSQSQVYLLKQKFFSSSPVWVQVDDSLWGNYGGWGRDVPANNTPGDGADAVHGAGLPGTGGNGGNLSSTIVPNSGTYLLTHGVTAQPQNTPGGRAGNPQTYCTLYVYIQENLLKGPMILYARNYGTRIGKRGRTHAGHDKPGLTNHNHGTAGKTNKLSGASNQWLHPILLQTVYHYIHDLYLAGDLELTASLLETYITALDQAAPTNSDWELPYENNRTRLGTFQHRLESNLDFFQNPAGWTPLLSLQANMTLFDHEVDEAIRTLFLAYWMQNQADKQQAAADAINSAIEKMEKERQEAIRLFTNANNQIPTLEATIVNIKSQLKPIQNELDNVYQKLQTQAAGDVQKEHVAKFLLKTAAAICSIIPEGQPELGLVGSGLNLLGEIDLTTDFSDTGEKLTEVLGDYAEIKLKTKAEDLEAAAKKTVKDPAGNEPDLSKAKSQAQSLTDIAEKIGPAVKQFTANMSELKAPQSEIEARLAELEKQDPAYQNLVKMIRKLNADKQRVSHLLTVAFQNVTDAESTITHTLLATDNLYAQRALTFDILNHEALLFTCGLRQSAFRRLIKYLYYLIKSYEYQLLEAYDSPNYQMEDLFKECDSLLTASRDGSLTIQQFDSLKPIFRKTLLDITENLVDKFENPSAGDIGIRNKTKQGTFVIQAADDLPPGAGSSGGATVFNIINFMDEGVILPSMENVRIKEIKVTDIQIASTPGINDQLTVNLEYADDGTLRGYGQLFTIRTSQPNDASMGSAQKNWGASASWDSKGNIILNPIVPSPDNARLLENLLNDPGLKGQGQDLLNFKPPAWANIIISTEWTGNSTEIPTSITCEYNLEFEEVPSNESTLVVRGPAKQHPLIYCRSTDLKAQADKNGQTDGNAPLLRMYPVASEVKLTPYGYLSDSMFSEWQDKNGQTVSKELSLKLTLDTDPTFARGDQILQVVYGPVSYREPLASVFVEQWALRMVDPITDKNKKVVPSKNWVVGFKVQYAITFVDQNGAETKLGPWSPWYSSADHKCAVVQDIPVDPSHTAVKRRLYRQFHDTLPPEMILEITNNDPAVIYTDYTP